jgi:hypothetical protein
MHNPAERADMRDEKAVGLAEILALEWQRQSLIGLQEPGESVRLNGVDAVVGSPFKLPS